ncbi:hypothetical protein SAMD00019534_002340 [Acytostelium subglobosum LB1]|uniref:hypothetical protein n=1 Tax=Acytostelium subglobosum LB1 TaxID=1410327 RepID=UPI000644959D|nr:hypothetical protein SAMD00019534_002340 [Acytostelium subglobosum LB1]GAM17059.1 hypothetical protein SAMD00019534_002340 [Acytostelium subglobosum LB1]|eukprot:XP_012759121.1 hypothetical protein SAMD00019534_002340 [Acytostelium subglobosum LB1]
MAISEHNVSLLDLINNGLLKVNTQVRYNYRGVQHCGYVDTNGEIHTTDGTTFINPTHWTRTISGNNCSGWGTVRVTEGNVPLLKLKKEYLSRVNGGVPRKSDDSDESPNDCESSSTNEKTPAELIKPSQKKKRHRSDIKQSDNNNNNKQLLMPSTSHPPFLDPSKRVYFQQASHHPQQQHLQQQHHQHQQQLSSSPLSGQQQQTYLNSSPSSLPMTAFGAAHPHAHPFAAGGQTEGGGGISSFPHSHHTIAQPPGLPGSFSHHPHQQHHPPIPAVPFHSTTTTTTNSALIGNQAADIKPKTHHTGANNSNTNGSGKSVGHPAAMYQSSPIPIPVTHLQHTIDSGIPSHFSSPIDPGMMDMSHFPVEAHPMTPMNNIPLPYFIASPMYSLPHPMDMAAMQSDPQQQQLQQQQQQLHLQQQQQQQQHQQQSMPSPYHTAYHYTAPAAGVSSPMHKYSSMMPNSYQFYSSAAHIPQPQPQPHPQQQQQQQQQLHPQQQQQLQLQQQAYANAFGQYPIHPSTASPSSMSMHSPHSQSSPLHNFMSSSATGPSSMGAGAVNSAGKQSGPSRSVDDSKLGANKKRKDVQVPTIGNNNSNSNSSSNNVLIDYKKKPKSVEMGSSSPLDEASSCAKAKKESKKSREFSGPHHTSSTSLSVTSGGGANHIKILPGKKQELIQQLQHHHQEQQHLETMKKELINEMKINGFDYTYGATPPDVGHHQLPHHLRSMTSATMAHDDFMGAEPYLVTDNLGFHHHQQLLMQQHKPNGVGDSSITMESSSSSPSTIHNHINNININNNNIRIIGNPPPLPQPMLGNLNNNNNNNNNSLSNTDTSNTPGNNITDSNNINNNSNNSSSNIYGYVDESAVGVGASKSYQTTTSPIDGSDVIQTINMPFYHNEHQHAVRVHIS